MRLIVYVFSVVLLSAGCASEPDPLDPAVTLGSGIDSFETLTNGDEVFIVQGPQGGFHFYGSVLVQGIDAGDPNDLADPRNPTTAFRVFSAGVRVDLDASTYTQGLQTSAAAQTYEMIGRLVILDILADDELADAEVVMEVEVSDTRGHVARDERTLIAIPHPANP